MEFARQYKPELCVSKDEYRPAITVPHVIQHRDKHYIIATDSYAGIIVPCEAGDDKHPSGVLPSEAIKAARGFGRSAPVHLALEESAAVIRGYASFVRADWRPVDMVNLMSKSPAFTCDKPTAITLNAKLLWNVARSLGSNELTLYSSDNPLQSVIVLPMTGDAFGVIMPVRRNPSSIDGHVKSVRHILGISS